MCCMKRLQLAVQSLNNASKAKPPVLVLHHVWADHVTARFAPFLKEKKNKNTSPDLISSDTQVSHFIHKVLYCQTNWLMLDHDFLFMQKTVQKTPKQTNDWSVCGFWRVWKQSKKNSHKTFFSIQCCDSALQMLLNLIVVLKAFKQFFFLLSQATNSCVIPQMIVPKTNAFLARTAGWIDVSQVRQTWTCLRC